MVFIYSDLKYWTISSLVLFCLHLVQMHSSQQHQSSVADISPSDSSFLFCQLSASNIAEQLWQELHSFREDPERLVPIIKNRKQCYEHQFLFSPYHPYQCLSTKEGSCSLTTLIADLVNEHLFAKMQRLPYLDKMAQQFANRLPDLECLQQASRPETAKQMMSEIKEVQNLQSKGFTFLIGVGFANQWEPLLSLLIDDGDSKRQKRKILMSEEYRYGGIGAVLLESGKGKSALICGVYLLGKHSPATQ